MRRAWAATLTACALAVGGVAAAAVVGGAPPAAPQGEPQSPEELRDDEFGVVRAGFGLQRRVEMYQWSAGEEGFERVWNAAPIESSGFPRNRRNPPELPLDSRRWWSSQAMLDGRPIDVEVLKALGDWRQFRPSFSRLPGNLAATFQPDGDGLSSSANPLDPQIGDLRVTWHVLELPPLAGKVELRDGRWQLAPRGAIAGAPLPKAPARIRADDERGNAVWPWLLALAALAALIIWRRR